MKQSLLLAAVACCVYGAVHSQCMTISCNSNTTVNNDAGQCGAVVNYTTPAVTANTCNGVLNDTFNFTGAMQTFVVPAGITSVSIKTWGAQGGANWVNNVNFGGYVAGDFSVTPGATLYVFVGGQATTITGGYNGGGNGEGAGKGGGGGSDVRMGGTTYNDRIIVAGGGGGAGYWSSLHVVGGEGGGLVGNNGYRQPDYATNPGGLGGTQSGPGANGTCVSFYNTVCAGGFGYGGAPSGCGCEGYGGGGGWYGGAGSGNCRGGGGGSGYALPSATNVSMATGARTGNGMVVISYAGASVATVNQTAGLPSGSLFPIGTTTNTFVASDAFGNTATCSFDITVNDTEIPVISNMPADIVLNADPGMCSTTATWTAPSYADNCTTTLASDYSSGSTFNVGVTTVTYIATDASGNADTSSFTVTVNDTEPPAWMNVPGDVTVSNDFNQCTAVVNWTPPTAMDNCMAPIITSSANSGDAFSVGQTVVSYVATDASGNSDTASFTVTVVDSQAPVVQCPADVIVSADSGMCSASNVTLGSLTFIENCSATTSDDAPAVFPIGTTVVTYTVTDIGGNAVNCQQNVTVLDTEAPVIANCPADVTMCPGVVIFQSPGALDNCAATLSQVAGPSSGDTLSAGNYTVMFVATDSSGNADTCGFTITVFANPNATLTLPFTTVCVNDGQYTLQGGSPAGGTWSGPGVSGSAFSPSTAGTGTQTITYMYTDNNGCSASATDQVVVSPCTGITESGQITFSMFPNPASEQMTFVASERGTMEIFDANGKLVYTQAITATQTEVSLNGFAQGNYSVRFTGESGSVSNAKLIIQR